MSYKKGFTPLETSSVYINKGLNIPRTSVKKLLTGFTLLEVLLVVGIIAILAGIVILAINPARQLAMTRNAQRLSDIKQINNAIQQFYIDNSYYPASTSLTTALTEVCDTGTSSSPSGITCTGLIDLSELVPDYIVAIPTDPSGASSTLTFIPTAYAATGGAGYKVSKDTSNRITLTAPLAELGASISIGKIEETTVSTLGVGLIAHYLMNDNEESTIVLDNKGIHNGIAVRNTSLMSTTSSVIGRALNFTPASNDSISIPDSNDFYYNTSDFTIGFWMKVAALPSNNLYILYEQRVQDSNRISLYYYRNSDGSDSRLVAQIAGVGGTFNLGVGAVQWTPTLDTWYYINFRRTGNLWEWMVNGNLLETTTNSSSVSDYAASIVIGARGGLYKLNGILDDYRIYNRSLTQDEINQLMIGTEEE